MKQLVLPTEKQFTTELIADDSFVGIHYSSNEKCMIIQKNINEFVSSNLEIIKELWLSNSKRDYANEILRMSVAKVFLFDTKKELLEWFAQD